MMKDKNKGNKTLAAVGAVVAVGLTPGILNSTPQCAPVQTPNAAITAAEVVAIDGNAYGFDELYAMQQGVGRCYAVAPGEQPQVATRYGSYRPSQPPINYGPQSSQKTFDITRSTHLEDLQKSLMAYCEQLIDADKSYIVITLDRDLTRDLGMSRDELKALAAEIKERYGVEVSYNRFYLNGQLNTLRLITEHIYKMTHR